MADEDQLEDWPVEHIPDPARLFLRVNARQLPRGVLHPGIFREHEGGMSTDWERYSTPEESRDRATTPKLTGIVALVTGFVRSLDGLEVLHAPDYDRPNRAHSEVLGIEQQGGMPLPVRKDMIRTKLFEHCGIWVLPPAES